MCQSSTIHSKNNVLCLKYIDLNDFYGKMKRNKCFDYNIILSFEEVI